MTALTYTCPYCRMESTPTSSSCPMCGAPVDVRAQSTAGGWTQLPPISDMAHIQAGQSSVQVEGTLSPIADWNLAADDSVYFPHQMLQWVEPSVRLDNMPMSKPWTRMRAGLPLIMAQATGPGHIAFAHDALGEVIAIPLPSMSTSLETSSRNGVTSREAKLVWRRFWESKGDIRTNRCTPRSAANKP